MTDVINPCRLRRSPACRIAADQRHDDGQCTDGEAGAEAMEVMAFGLVEAAFVLSVT